MSAICITIPKSIKWEDYQKELAAVEDESQEMNYRIPTLPKDVQVGDKCYICHDGYIKGWMKISFIGKRDGFQCTTTGENWDDGYYVSRTGQFHYLKEPIPMKGFMGYRKIEDIQESKMSNLNHIIRNVLTEIKEFARAGRVTVQSLPEFIQLCQSIGINDKNVDTAIGEYAFIEVGSSLERCKMDYQYTNGYEDYEGGADFYKRQYYFQHQHKNVLRLEFDDNIKIDDVTKVALSPAEMKTSARSFAYKGAVGFNEDMARELKQFVESQLSYGKDVKFIVHCRQGASRSAAIGTYITKKIGDDINSFLGAHHTEDNQQFRIGAGRKGEPKRMNSRVLDYVGKEEGWEDGWYKDPIDKYSDAWAGRIRVFGKNGIKSDNAKNTIINSWNKLVQYHGEEKAKELFPDCFDLYQQAASMNEDFEHTYHYNDKGKKTQQVDSTEWTQGNNGKAGFFHKLGDSASRFQEYEDGNYAFSIPTKKLMKSGLTVYGMTLISSTDVNQMIKHGDTSKFKNLEEFFAYQAKFAGKAMITICKRNGIEMSNIGYIAYPGSSSSFNEMFCHKYLKPALVENGAPSSIEIIDKQIIKNYNITVDHELAKALGCDKVDVYNLEMFAQELHDAADVFSIRQKINEELKHVINAINKNDVNQYYQYTTLSSKEEKADKSYHTDNGMYITNADKEAWKKSRANGVERDVKLKSGHSKKDYKVEENFYTTAAKLVKNKELIEQYYTKQHREEAAAAVQQRVAGYGDSKYGQDTERAYSTKWMDSQVKDNNADVDNLASGANWQIKKFDDVCRHVLNDLFKLDHEFDNVDKSKAIVVFDDNVAGGATLDSICQTLVTSWGGNEKLVIPITLSFMHISRGVDKQSASKQGERDKHSDMKIQDRDRLSKGFVDVSSRTGDLSGETVNAGANADTVTAAKSDMFGQPKPKNPKPNKVAAPKPPKEKKETTTKYKYNGKTYIVPAAPKGRQYFRNLIRQLNPGIDKNTAIGLTTAILGKAGKNESMEYNVTSIVENVLKSLTTIQWRH